MGDDLGIVGEGTKNRTHIIVFANGKFLLFQCLERGFIKIHTRLVSSDFIIF